MWFVDLIFLLLDSVDWTPAFNSADDWSPLSNEDNSYRLRYRESDFTTPSRGMLGR